MTVEYRSTDCPIAVHWWSRPGSMRKKTAGGSGPMDFEGGEIRVKAVQLIEGDEVWRAGEQGRLSKELLTAAPSQRYAPGLDDLRRLPGRQDRRNVRYW
jgi:hypothetical protein